MGTPFWQPIINCGCPAEHSTCNHDISIMILRICSCYREHHSSKATKRKQNYKGDTKQHRCFIGNSPFIHGSDPIKDFYSCWNSDEHCCIHKVEFSRNWHSNCEHMMRP